MQDETGNTVLYRFYNIYAQLRDNNVPIAHKNRYIQAAPNTNIRSNKRAMSTKIQMLRQPMEMWRRKGGSEHIHSMLLYYNTSCDNHKANRLRYELSFLCSKRAYDNSSNNICQNSLQNNEKITYAV